MSSEKDIVLPELTDCDREPITFLERIQDFGFLLALSNDWIIVRASANLRAMLDIDATDAIGMPLNDLFVAQTAHEIRNRMVVLRAHGGSERIYGIALKADRHPFDLALHYSGDLLVLEGEPSVDSEGRDAASLVRTMIARLDTMKTMDAFHRDCARQIRALTGFSRVMVYRFDDSGDGEVIAESLNGPVESYLGLRYPAADIPVQARALYVRNPFRIIGDVDCDAVPLLPPHSETTPLLDLSLAVTRAVSPIHLEYLRNMGVSASLSISIIVEGRLWGLLACHNDRPGVPSFVKRSASELFAQMYSMMLESRLRQATSAVDLEMRRRVDRMVGSIAGDTSLLSRPVWLHAELAEIVGCDGVAIVMDGQITVGGLAPAPDRVDRIVSELRLLQVGQVFSTDSLVASFPDAFEPSEQTAGMLSIPLSLEPRDYLLLFRREQPQNVRWGGDPAQAKFKDAPGVRISPRKSFEAFTVTTRNRSNPFSDATRRAAELVRAALLDIVVRRRDEGGAGAHATERQELLIAELNHRVRNILALIRGLINQTASGEHDVAGYVRSLNGRVQALARAHDQVTRQNWGPGLLSALFDHEIDAYVPTHPERFLIAGPPIHLVPQAYSTMALVIHELVTNSLKYGALSDAGRVEVTIDLRADDGLYVAWREIGGPAVKPPTRRGFGSEIIERTVPFDLQGSTDMRFTTAGLEVDFFVPMQFVWTADVPIANVPHTPRALRTESQNPPLANMNVLLLEDNMLVALEAEDMLRTLGAAEVRAVATVQAARRTIDGDVIDFAVLDVNVGNENSLDFARECAARKIPFVFASGYGNDIALGERHRRVAVINKPYLIDDVDNAVTETIRLHRLLVDVHSAD